MRSLARLALGLALALTALPGCKKGSPAGPRGFDSAEALGKAFADAVSRGDADAAAALFTPDSVLRAALTCQDPGVIDGTLASIAKHRGELLARIKSRPGTQLTFLNARSDGGEQHFPQGSQHTGCTVNDEIVTYTMRFQFDEKHGTESLGVHPMNARVVHYAATGRFLEDFEEM